MLHIFNWLQLVGDLQSWAGLFVKYLMLKKLKPIPFGLVMFIFPHPSLLHPSTSPHLPLPALCFHFPSLLSSCVIYCSTGWRLGADWWCSSLTLVGAAMLLFWFLPVTLWFPLCASSYSIPPFFSLPSYCSGLHQFIPPYSLINEGTFRLFFPLFCILFLIHSTLPLPKINSFPVLEEKPRKTHSSLDDSKQSISLILFFTFLSISLLSHSHPVACTVPLGTL